MDKTCVLFMGSKKAREALRDEFVEDPPVLYDKPVKLVQSESYIGETLGRTIAESITLTISKREGLAKKGIFDTKNRRDKNRITSVELMYSSFLAL